MVLLHSVFPVPLLLGKDQTQVSKRKPTKAQIRAVFAAMGERTSPAKAKASRENGKKGGRPRKPVRG